jgi:hypothetical protein
VKKLNEQNQDKTNGGDHKVRPIDTVDARDSSGSDSDDPDKEPHSSVLFLQVREWGLLGCSKLASLFLEKF